MTLLSEYLEPATFFQIRATNSSLLPSKSRTFGMVESTMPSGIPRAPIQLFSHGMSTP
jgi:hypothetical protein